MVKNIFWADQLADNIVKRRSFNYIDKEFKLPRVIGIKSSTSISGVPHIGNASDVIRHDAVVRALEDLGKKVKFIWVAEDMDPLRKLPSGIPKKIEKFLGVPVADIPCPYGCCRNYSEHFSKLFVESLWDNFGTKPKFISTATIYRRGDFFKDIEKIMNNLSLVREIVNKSRRDSLPEDWTPWKPVCEKCGKIITTQVIDFSKDGVKYECKDYEFKEYGKKAYTKLKGCGYKGVSDLKKGNGKLLWRIEWGMLWSSWKIFLEGAGKEHFMPSGSFWTAGEICEKVLGWPEPYPGKNPIQPYEYVTVNGKKMSASVGNTVATWEWCDFAPAETLRLLFLKKPSKVRDLKYEEIFKFVDELDYLEKVYFDKEKIKNEKESEDNKRLFMMSCVDIPKEFREPVSFGFLAILSQIYANFPDVTKVLEKLGHKVLDKKFIEKRFKQAQSWVNKYGPDYMKFELQKEMKVDLNSNEKEALKLVGKALEKGGWNEKTLFDEFYRICEEVKIKPEEFFKTTYKVLIDKERGPRLASFVLALERDKVLKLFKQIK